MPGCFYKPSHAVALALSIAALLSASSAMGAGSFDHSSFDRLLSQAVSNGRVDYAKFRNRPEFDAYMAALGAASIDALSTDERLAFWINAYNAATIRNVLDNPGLRKPTDIAGFFDRKKFRIAGRMLTLNDIENTIIRPQFREPLIHFGLVCAARSCPPLLPRAYSGRTVRATLAANARAYLASQYNRFDPSSSTLTLSKIFEWYREDFGGESGLRTFVRTYGTPQMQKGVTATTRIVSMEYDWTVNAK